MSKISIEYCQERAISPLTFWVHKSVDSDIWESALLHEPPMPAPVVGKGYPRYEIVHRGYRLIFASIDEIEHCISTLSRKVLPTTQSLAEKAGYPGYQHIHWLSKWPGGLKSWKERQIITKFLEKLIEKAV